MLRPAEFSHTRSARSNGRWKSSARRSTDCSWSTPWLLTCPPHRTAPLRDLHQRAASTELNRLAWAELTRGKRDHQDAQTQRRDGEAHEGFGNRPGRRGPGRDIGRKGAHGRASGEEERGGNERETGERHGEALQNGGRHHGGSPCL